MKILIADDEELVRVGLRDILMKIVPEAEIREAVNGRAMIEAVEELQPDICFADIRMPGINGLEAIEHLCGIYQEIFWIILSGYSDFGYARTALTLGALDYLLKPATEDEVKAAIDKAAAKMRDFGLQKREKFEYRIGGVLNNSSALEFDDYLIEIGCYSALVFIADIKDVDQSVLFQRELSIELRSRIDEDPPEGYAGLFNILDGLPAVIAGGNRAEEFLLRLDRRIPGRLRDKCRIVFSPAQNSLSGLIACFESSPDLKSVPEKDLVNEHSEKSARIVRQAEKLVRKLYNEPIGVAQIAERLNITPNYLSSLFKKYMDVSFTKYITDIRLSEAPKILDASGITVKEAATRLGYMSSRHFSRLFREKYGMLPTDYLGRKS
ncbi:MAG: response regulator [Spirochaetales bacterium]|nr:response regulator [Spirochaetales bacterium]